jgi:hypothetical protein
MAAVAPAQSCRTSPDQVLLAELAEATAGPRFRRSDRVPARMLRLRRY